MTSASSLRICRASEAPLLMEYIHRHWKANHILSVSKDLLDWQYLDARQASYNFLTAVDQGGRFLGILGYIPVWRYDPSLRANGDVWLAIWSATTEESARGVGVRLMYEVHRQGYCSIGAIGITSAVQSIYKAFKHALAVMVQYFIPNPDCGTFRIAEFRQLPHLIPSGVSTCHIRTIEPEEAAGITHPYQPRKTVEYLRNRYFEHPFYRYQLWGVLEKRRMLCVFVVRKVQAVGSACLRVVDIYGEPAQAGNLASEFIRLMHDHDAEYLDLCNYGLDPEIFIRMGFYRRQEKMLLPNYFEPFERRNVDINIAFRSQLQPYVVYRGDSDQDRPNLLSVQ